MLFLTIPEIDSQLLTVVELKERANERCSTLQTELNHILESKRFFDDIDFLNKFRVNLDAALGQLAQLTMEEKSLHWLRRTLLVQQTQSNGIAIERIIIGAGMAGTAVFAELPKALRDHYTAEQLPAVLVLNDPRHANQWRKDGSMLMGQPAKIQTPQIFSSHSEDFADKQVSERNPYDYVMAIDFDRSLTVTQSDLGMNILNVAATKIESKASYVGDTPWEHENYPHRIQIQISATPFYIYTQHLDLCIGPGPTRKLSHIQLPPTLETKLTQENKVVYGQDFGDGHLKGHVIFYGGGGRNAGMILDILHAFHPDVKSFTWVARNGEDFETNSMFNRMFHDLDVDPRCTMVLGELISVDQLTDTGQLQLTFGKPTRERKTRPLDTIASSIICDQLVVSVGQDSPALTRNLHGFVPCQLENDFPGLEEYEIIPLGTHSPDRSIIAWGAAGAMGLGLDTHKEEFNVAVGNHARTLPRESRATVGIFRSAWTIKTMMSLLNQMDSIRFPGDSPSPHALDLPEINTATRRELYDIIGAYAPELSAEAHLEMVNKILQIRAMHPLGLSDLSVLKTEVPYPVLEALERKYFPFALEPIALTSSPIKNRLKISTSQDTFFATKKPDEFTDAVTILRQRTFEDVLLPVIQEPQSEDDIRGRDDEIINRTTLIPSQ